MWAWPFIKCNVGHQVEVSVTTGFFYLLYAINSKWTDTTKHLLLTGPKISILIRMNNNLLLVIQSRSSDQGYLINGVT